MAYIAENHFPANPATISTTIQKTASIPEAVPICLNSPDDTVQGRYLTSLHFEAKKFKNP